LEESEVLNLKKNHTRAGVSVIGPTDLDFGSG